MNADKPIQEIGYLLNKQKLIKEDDLDKARRIQKEIGGRLSNILIRIGAISEDVLLPVLSKQLQIPILDNNKIPVDISIIKNWLLAQAIDIGWWIDHNAIAWQEKNSINCILGDYHDNSNLEIIERLFNNQAIHWYMTSAHNLENILNSLEKSLKTESDGDENSHLREMAEEAPVIEMVNNFISQAAEQGASDIHIEPYEKFFEVRYRIDGILQKQFTIAMERYSAVASRIKLVSELDISEKRLPQDGRIHTKASGKEFDIRVSVLPGVFGESIVMRLLLSEKKQLEFHMLGLSQSQQTQIQHYISQPYGIILVTGPTGSGKSTSLYTALKTLVDGEKKIITVEDPVEYQLEGITQVQTINEIGFNFSAALRSVLRQDPDIIMVGEIRDLETAEIAIQSSLTGHLVLSTLHTNNAVGAFNRLIDMGVEPFLVATPIEAVIAQRLVRKLCSKCAIPSNKVLDDIREVVQIMIEHKLIEDSQENWKEKGPGCSDCNGTGYKGRIGLFEMVTVSQEIRQLIIHQASTDELWKQAKKEGSISLREDGFAKAWQGFTSIEEVLRST